MDFWQLATATTALITMVGGALLLTARRKLAVADLRQHQLGLDLEAAGSQRRQLEQDLEAAGSQRRQLERDLEAADSQRRQSEQDLEAALTQLRMVEDVDRYREDHARQSVALLELQAEIDGRNGRLLTLQAEIESRTTERDVLDQSVDDADQRLRDASQQLDGLREQINQAGIDLAAAIQAVADSRLSIERHRIAAAIALKGAVDASAEECRQNAAKVVELQGLQSSLRDWYAEKKVVYDDLCREVDKLNDKIDFVEMGHFDVKLSYDSSAAYIQAISDLKERQKAMIAAGEAVVCTTNWTINGSLTEGKANTKRLIRLTLRTFNNECEVCVAKVTWRNYARMQEQISQSVVAINKTNVGNDIRITQGYLDLKMLELKLAYEEKVKKQQETELLREERAREREEMRAQKELEAAAKKAAEEEARQIKALAKARAELEAATAAERELLEQRIQDLEKRITAAGDLKERAISMAQQTRVGHVYVISNVGAFGQDVFKIGMTRRLEPAERVHELGGASVPFPFDIHSMVFTQDAPALERALHSHLDAYRINRVNNRKEFFRVPLAVVRDAVQAHAPDATFVDEPDAQQYFASLPPDVVERLMADDVDTDEEELFPAELV